jgi:hypothetical protein
VEEKRQLATSFEKLHDRQRALDVNDAVAVALRPDDGALGAQLDELAAFVDAGLNSCSDLGGVSEVTTGACADVEDLGATLTANFAASARGNGHGEVTRI